MNPNRSLNIKYYMNGALKRTVADANPTAPMIVDFAINGNGKKIFDVKIANPSYTADVVQQTDYYPYGMVMPNRNGSDNSYRYGFQGQEKDDEVKGAGNSVNYTYRMHDPRIGRFLSIDPDASKYPFMSVYCFAANNPIYYIDDNGKGPEPPKNAYVNTLLQSYGKFIFEAIIASNNTSRRELEKWAKQEAGFDKSTAWKIKGAVGEALVAFGLTSHIDPSTLFYFDVSLQKKTALSDRSTPDIVMTVTVGEIKSMTGKFPYVWFNEQQKDLIHPFNDYDGNSYNETYSDEVLVKSQNRIYKDFETYEFQYEVKTLKTRTDTKGINKNIAILDWGMQQVQNRIASATAENPIGVLVTDKSTYLAIYNASQNGNSNAAAFINRVDDFIDNGGKLFLVNGLSSDADKITYSLRDKIAK